MPAHRKADVREQRTVLLTGASTGLGLAIARALFALPYRLILTAREKSMGRFAQEGIVESERIHLRVLDVSNESDRMRVVGEAVDRFGGVDILINNAGVSYRAVIEHVTDVDRLLQMQVNFQGPMELTRLVLPAMRRKQYGRILNVSSVGGMMAMPTMGIYSASKFALEGATEALYYEVRPFGVRVSLVQPGFIHSRSFENVRHTSMSAESVRNLDDAYHPHYEYMTPFIERLMGFSWATPERVAKTVIRTMERKNPPLRVPATFDARLFYYLRRLLPRRVYHAILYRSLPYISWGLVKPPGRSVPPRTAVVAEKLRLPLPSRLPGAESLTQTESLADPTSAPVQLEHASRKDDAQ